MRTAPAIPAAFAAVLLLAVPAAAEDEVVHDHWFAQFQRETKAGWAHERRVRSEIDGKPVVITESEMVMTRGPQGEEMKTPIRGSSRFVEDENGVVLSYSTSMDIGLGPQTREGTVKDGVISAIEDGKPRSVPYPEGALGPAALQRAMAAKLEPGSEGEALEFAPLDPGKGSKITWKVPKETKLANVLGHYAWLFPVQKNDPTGIPETLLLDGFGRVWGGAINLGLIHYYRTEEVVAKADRDPASWMTSRVIAPDRVIPADAIRKRTVLRLSRKAGTNMDVPESPSQKVLMRGDGAVIDLELTMGKPKGDIVVWMRPYIGDDQDPGYLAETPLVELSHPRLKKFAENAVGELKDGLSCARVLELRVRQSVRPSPANVGFSTAAGVISSGTGDSTEAAILVVGFARALGLPARLVAGFVYWGPDQWPGGRQPKGAFAFQAWAEIYAGENLWHAVDPMRMDIKGKPETVRELIGRGGFDATHVAVLRHDADTKTPFTDIVLPVLEFMDGLEIEVVEPKE